MARVLVVDDEGLMRTMVQVVCNRLGHETLMAGSIQEALRMAVEPDPRMAGVTPSTKGTLTA